MHLAFEMDFIDGTFDLGQPLSRMPHRDAPNDPFLR